MKKEYEENLYGYIKEYIKPNKALLLKKEFETINDAGYTTFLNVPLKNPIVTLLLSIWLGRFGIDRFYLNDTTNGVWKLVITFVGLVFTLIGSLCPDITCLILGSILSAISTIWSIIDIFYCFITTKEVNYKSFTKILPKDSPLK